MKALTVNEKDIDTLINDFGFSKVTLYDEQGNEKINAIAYEYDMDTYIALRKQKEVYVLEFLILNPDVYVWQNLIYYNTTYTNYFLPSILIKLASCGIIKECEIEDYK